MAFDLEVLLHASSQRLKSQSICELHFQWARVVHRYSDFIGFVRVTADFCFIKHSLHHWLGLQACVGRPELHRTVANIANDTKRFRTWKKLNQLFKLCLVETRVSKMIGQVLT